MVIEIEIPLNTPKYLTLYIYIILNILNIKIFNIGHKKIKIALSIYDLTHSLESTYDTKLFSSSLWQNKLSYELNSRKHTQYCIMSL